MNELKLIYNKQNFYDYFQTLLTKEHIDQNQLESYKTIVNGYIGRVEDHDNESKILFDFEDINA